MLDNSLAKQNFCRASEDAVNQQIQLYRMAQQTYLAASAFFDHCGVALPVIKQLKKKISYGRKNNISVQIGIYEVLS
jgi:hypothetical protein